MTRFTAGATLALVTLTLAVPAGGERVRLNAVPTPVLDAVRARFKGARLTGADKELQGGTTVYEIALTDQGRNIDVTLTPEGAILLIKKEIAAKDLPERVTRALEDAYPGATFREVEEVTTVRGRAETLAHFEVVVVTAQQKIVEVKVNAEGQIVK